MADFSRQDLELMICDLAGIKKITPLITKHISELCIQYHMTWKEIARCLTWYVEIGHGSIQVQYGIKTICTSVREKAEQYFKKLELDRQKQSKEASKVVEYQENNIIFNISLVKNKKRQPKQLDINTINVEGDNDEHGD